MRNVCTALVFLEKSCIHAGCLVEAHIALACLACTYRWNKALLFLKRTLSLVWLFGVMVAGADVLLVHLWTWVPKEGCRWSGLGVFDFTAATLLAVFLICLGAYIPSAL